MKHSLKLYDRVRLDHFRGFVAYWEIPAGEKSAANGRWRSAPVYDFFNTLLKSLPGLPVIAEDLGVITADVREVMTAYGFPGVKVLTFSFGEDMAASAYSPHNHHFNSVVYTGTHDTNTVVGWFEKEAGPDKRDRFFRYTGKGDGHEVHWEMIRLALMSVADTAIISVQDTLGLGEEARMNKPASAEGNWEWRLLPGQMHPSSAERLSLLSRTYGRE